MSDRDLRGAAGGAFRLELQILSNVIATHSNREVAVPQVVAARVAGAARDSLVREEVSGNRPPVPLATV